MRAVRCGIRRGAACGRAPRRAHSADFDCRDRVRWRGATPPRPRAADWNGRADRRAALPAASRFGCERRRCLQRVDRFGPTAQPFQQDATGCRQDRVERIVATCDFEPRQQGLPRAGGTRRVHLVQRVLHCLRRQAMRFGKRRFGERLVTGQHQRIAQSVPGVGSARSDAAAAQRRSRAVSPSPRMINRPAKPEQCRLAPRVDFQHSAVGQFGLAATSPLRAGLRQAAAAARPTPAAAVPTSPSVVARTIRVTGLFLGQCQVQQCRG